MASKAFALLCLVGIADCLVKRAGPSEGLAKDRLGSLAASITEAAVSDVMTLGSARTLEDVKQLAQVARVAVADELGVSPSQAYSEDMARKALLAAGDVARDLVEVPSGPGDADEYSYDTEAEDEADSEHNAEWAALSREAFRDLTRARSSGEFAGAHGVERLTDFYVKEAVKGVETEIADIFGPEALDASHVRKEVLDKLGEIVTGVKETFEEDAAEHSDDEDSQAWEVSKKVAARAEEASQAIEELKAGVESGDSDGEYESSGLDTELGELADGISDLVDSAWSKLKQSLPDEVVDAAEGAAAAVGDIIGEAEEEEAPPGEAIGEAASSIFEGVAEAMEDASDEDVGELVDVAAKGLENVLDAAAPAVQGLSKALLDAAEDDEAESSEEAEEAGEIAEKVASGFAEIVDAVAPAVQGLWGEAAEAFDEEEREEPGAEKLDEEEEEEKLEEDAPDTKDEDEELDMMKQEEEEGGEIADKISSGLGEIFDAVAPVVTDLIDVVAGNDTDDNEE